MPQFTVSLIKLSSSERKSTNFLPEIDSYSHSLAFINKMQGDNCNLTEFGREWEMLSYSRLPRLCLVSSDQEGG